MRNNSQSFSTENCKLYLRKTFEKEMRNFIVKKFRVSMV